MTEKIIQKRYLNTSTYNRCLVINQLRNMVKEKGGKLLKHQCNYEVENRDIPIAIKEQTIKLERIAKRMDSGLKLTAKRDCYIKKIKEDIHEWKKINNAPVLIQGNCLSLEFVYQGTYYHFWCDDNPLFPSYVVKTSLTKNKIGRNYYAEELGESWLINSLFYWTCTPEDRMKAASILWEALMSAPMSRHFRETQKRRVPNLYNGGYHYETVEFPEDFISLEFEEV